MPDLQVSASEGTILDEATVQGFKTSLRGQLLCPGDGRYDAARKVFNAMIDRRPAWIARCTGAADVITCVQFARTHNLFVSVRGGGHNVAGTGVCEGGLMIDLSPMKGIRVEPTKRTVHAEAGLTWQEFDRETQAFGLATTGGLFSTTGIAGFTLGGGLGWLMAKHGLACDNLLSADVVTADGRLLTASDTENPDLFWGLRGGGGNFGIVTSFEYRLHPVGPLLAGILLYPMAKGKEVFHFYGEYVRQSPDTLRADIGLLTAPDGKPAVGILLCYAGAIDEGERLVQPLREFGPPVADMVRPMRYCEVQTMLDDVLPPGRLNYWKSNFVASLDDAAIETLIRCAQARPSPTSFIAIEHMHGAATRVSPDATAFAHRHAQFALLFLATWTDPAESQKHLRWARESWEAMQPFSAGRVYVNYLGEEGAERVREAYGPNYDRLVALKNTYDPTNFFRLNQNITPTA